MSHCLALDLSATAANIGRRLALANAQAEVCEIILPVLASFDGKKLSKRIETAVSMALGATYYVRYSTEYGMRKLFIWNDTTIPFGDRISLLLVYDTDTVYSHEACTRGIKLDEAGLQEHYKTTGTTLRLGYGYSTFRAKHDAVGVRAHV